MKIDIYFTSNQYLEEPMKIRTCDKFLKPSSDSCDSGTFKYISKQIADVEFGKRFFDCENNNCISSNNCVLKAKKAIQPKNKELVCNCGCYGTY